MRPKENKEKPSSISLPVSPITQEMQKALLRQEKSNTRPFMTDHITANCTQVRLNNLLLAFIISRKELILAYLKERATVNQLPLTAMTAVSVPFRVVLYYRESESGRGIRPLCNYFRQQIMASFLSISCFHSIKFSQLDIRGVPHLICHRPYTN